MFAKLSAFLPRLWTNWITLTGSVITTVAGCTIVLAVAAETVSPSSNPYTSAVAFLAMPMAFVGGLLLIPIGFWWDRLRRRKKGQPVEEDAVQAAFRAALKDKKAKRRILFVGSFTFLNLLIIGAAGHSALGYMDSVEFCGTLCHSVMEPEYNAYLRSPHSRVKCVECHIGPGASWAVKSKISGLRQVWAVMTDDFSRPIPAPVKALRPARDTCEQCHWPAKFHGNRVAFHTHFADDEENSPEVSAVLLKVGGEDPSSGDYHGIHWHVSPDVQVRFEVLDDKREKIGKVWWTLAGEQKAVYQPEKPGGEVKEERLMDCVDCHNRPTHIYDASPGAAVDRAMAAGSLDRGVPFLHAVAVKALESEGLTREEAEPKLRAAMEKIYAADHPDAGVAGAKLDAAAAVLADLYRQNVYPRLEITWDTYPSHLGHRGEEVDTRGCFRCHDDKHETADGDSLSQDCDLCHEILQEEESPDELPDSLRSLLALRQPVAEEKADDDKADDDKAGDDKANEDKADDGKADDEKVDEDKASDGKADDEPADEAT